MPTVELLTRFGGGADPTIRDMKKALMELYVENPSIDEGTYKEHPNTWLTYGYENGPKWIVFTLDVYRGGRVIFSKLEDQEDLDPVFEKQMMNVSQEEALRLWDLLRNGEIEALMNENREPI